VKHPHLVVLALLFLFGGFLVCAGFVFIGATVWHKQRGDDHSSVRIVPVVVASVDMPAGTKITDPAKMLLIKSFPEDAEPPACFKNPEDLRGQVLVRDVDKNTPITSKDVSRDKLARIPDGKRAMTVRVGSDAAMTGPLVLPGSQVDIIGNVLQDDDPKKFSSKVIVENVLVLEVNTQREAPKEGGIILNTATVTLAVTVEEAQKLAEATQRGPLTFVVRKPPE